MGKPGEMEQKQALKNISARYVSIGADINTEGQIGDISLSTNFSDIGVYLDILSCLRGARDRKSKRSGKQGEARCTITK